MKRIAVKSIDTCRLKYAQFLSKEVKDRINYNMKNFEQLPFIVGSNPYIRKVHETYLQSLDSLSRVNEIDDSNVKDFSSLLDQLLANHSNTLIDLSHGMRECSKYINQNQVQVFIDNFIKWRIGIRLLVENYTKNGVLTEVKIEDVVRFVLGQLKEPFLMQYGRFPDFDIHGSATIPFIASHVEYMMTELIKNSVFATISNAKELKPINILISKNVNVVIRIRDLGGGIHPNTIKNIFNYAFSTAAHDHMQYMVAQQSGGILAGLGYGLGMTRVYSEFFEGSIDVVSLYEYGTDTFLRLKPVTELEV
eukprot:NODE_172_length_15988_cov_0.603940.p5 type:complete len:307 gc:universal NODE_172_length_15988_cov_0.603940:15752-14832(-)